MIITRTPLRISLIGGGSDIPEFYQREFGAVVSFAIDKYVYVAINQKFDGRTRVSYSKTENVAHYSELQHDLARETLAHFDLNGLEITSVSDIPGEGSGLGSSSAFTVGLCKAIVKCIDGRVNVHPSVFADLAFGIERGRCEHPVGKQDQYAVSYGGLHYFQFNQDDSVVAEALPLKGYAKSDLERSLMLFWTGQTRQANVILADQAVRMENNPSIFDATRAMRDGAILMRAGLIQGNVDFIGHQLHASWMLKRALSKYVSDTSLDSIYDRALLAGAIGGKLCGAGGGGFFLFWVPPNKHESVRKAIGLRQVPFRMVDRGSEIIYNGDSYAD